MKCEYILNGQKFEDELSLDNYLLSVGKLSDSDVVYKLSVEVNNTNNILKLTAKDSINYLQDKKQYDYSDYGDLDLDEIVAKYPAVGVTDLLRKMHQTNSERPLFPIFKDDEYWSRKKNDYINGIFDDEEKELFFEKIGEKDGKPIYDIPTITEELFKKMRELRTKVWKEQALIGTAVHDVFSIYFSLTEEKKQYVRDLDKDKIREIIKYRLQHNGKLDYKYINNDSIINSIIDACIVFKDKLLDEYGKDAYIRTELKITTEGSYNNLTIHIVGQIDLFIQSNNPSNPKSAIIDFKCSPNHYSRTDPAKKRTYCYQLALYRKILENLGIGKKVGIKLIVAPVQFTNFKYDKDRDKCTIEGITLNEPILQELEDTNEYTENGQRIATNLSQIFPYEPADTMDTTDLLNTVLNVISKWFPVPQSWRDVSPERVANFIKIRGGVLFDKTSGHWVVYKKGSKKEIEAESEKENKDAATVELTRQITNDMKESIVKLIENTKRYRHDIRRAQLDKEPFEPNVRNQKGKSAAFIKEFFRDFADGDKYELFEPTSNEGIIDILDLLGILLFKNKQTGNIDVVQISKALDLFERIPLGGDLNTNKLGNKKYLFGTFLSDIKSATAPNALPLESTYGNVEAMQAMLVVNCLHNSFKGRAIRSIQVLKCYGDQQSMTTTNKQLLYNFKTLCKLSESEDFKIQNNFKNIKLLSNIEILRENLSNIILGKTRLSNKLRELDSALIKGEESIPDKELMLDDLIDLKTQLEEENSILKGLPEDLYEYYENPAVKLYFQVANAITEVSNIDMILQTEDHDKLVQGGIKESITEGLAGSYTDNPGTLQNKNLNKLSDLVTRAYQQVRDELTGFNYELRERLNKFRESQGYGYLGRITFRNQVNMFMNLYEHNSDGTLDSKMMFRNPYKDGRLNEDEKEFLKFALFAINKNRYSKLIESMDDLEIQLNSSDSEKYLRIPLSKGSFDSTLAQSKSWINGIKEKIKLYDSLEKIKHAVIDEMLGEFTETTIKKANKHELWEMANRFDRGETERDDFLRKGTDYFDLDLESLLLKHESAYSLKRNLDKILPIVKSIALNISYLSIIQNKNFSQDIQYVKDYVKTKIFNLPIEDANTWGALYFPIKKLQMMASKFALAYNPKQLYQNLDGLWKDISLFIRKPDGDTSFTKENLIKSFFWIAKDLVHFGNGISLGEMLNYTYGINDMDMNTLTDHLKSNTGGIFNFWNVGFRFASRPDYYNRMTIFGAQMMGDKCFDAHVKVNGRWIYDFNQDKRFNLLINNDKSNITEYNKQKALYIAMAQLFVRENTLNADGTVFLFDPNKFNPFPRAYTNQQAESMKALSDRIYGYYSHEKKSLMQSYTVGGLFFQMATYWSSKKNLWIGREGFDQQGYLVQYEENGEKYYQKIDETGNIVIVGESELSDSEKEQAIPYMVWKGRPVEGILITIKKLILTYYDPVGHPDGPKLSDIWGVDERDIDPDLLRLYRSNMRQFLYDMFMMLFFGSFLAPSLLNGADDYYKKHKEDGMDEAIKSNLFLWQTGMIKSSFDDFDPYHSIFGKVVDWTPFMVSQMTRTSANLMKWVSQDRDTYDTFVNTFAATRQLEPILNTTKIILLNRKIGDNGKEE